MIKQRVALLTSGGDAPGMNAAIRAVVRTALANEFEVVGFFDGFDGLTHNDYKILTSSFVANIIQAGGTALRTKRFPEFADGNVRQKAIDVLKHHDINALIVLGGDGSFRGAKRLSEECGIQVIGIPCTIDNDIEGTRYTIGFDTAKNTALDAIDKIRDTAFSHSRNFLVEVMGRAAGFLAADVGLAGGAELVLVPEQPMSYDEIIEQLSSRKRFKKGSIVVVAEASNPGWSFQLSAAIEKQLDKIYKVCVLGHIQRGGKPSVYDRKVASLMGYYAMNAVITGKSEQMVAYNCDEFELVNFPAAHSKPRQLNDQRLLAINSILAS